MQDNDVIRTIRERRSSVSFQQEQVPETHLQTILEAARWTPSYLNSQPWSFIVVTDEELRNRMAEAVKEVTVAWRGLSEAPLVVAVVVDPEQDALHYVEDAAAATLTMALAAKSLGLSSYWIGVHRLDRKRWRAESELCKLLRIPKRLALVSLLPLGYALRERKGLRRPLAEVVFSDIYGSPYSASEH